MEHISLFKEFYVAQHAFFSGNMQYAQHVTTPMKLHHIAY